MMHTLLYAEMNQAVPGASLSPGHEGGYGECQVPSPSQWSDPCYSPPSFHSPQHLPVELEKVKEEPFSPPSAASYLTLPPSPPTPHLSPSAAVPAPHHGASPYARPSSGGGHVTKQDAYESCINLAELLNDNQTLIQQHGTSSSSPSYGTGYPDHPLLRGRLEDTNAFQKISGASGAHSTGAPAGGAFDGAHHLLHHLDEPAAPYHHPSRSASSPYKDTTSEGLSFLESLVDVKQEAEDDVCVGSSCGSPAVPSPGGSPGGQREIAPQVSCQRDILETVEILALEHNRRDVQRVSDSLNIPRDPAQWSVDDVRAWLKFQASQLELPPLRLDFWSYGGPSLLKLTEQQFRQLAPIGGELLYAKLEIWREAWKSTKLSPPSSSGSPSSSPHHHHQPYNFIQQHPNAPSPQEHHHLMAVAAPHQVAAAAAAHLQHLQQQQGLQPSGGASPQGGAPASPPLPLVSPMSQVPTPVAQVSQQQQQQLQQAASASAPPSPQQQGTAATAVYLEEQCLDMAALLQQPASSPKTTQGNHNPTHCSPQDEAYDSEDDMEEETCSSGGSGRGGTHIHLWQFLKELLQQPQLYGSCIRWLDRQKGVFKIEDSVRVARLWGKRKNRPAMNYDKLSRSIRQYYKKGIMKKTERSQRLVYQFCHPYCL